MKNVIVAGIAIFAALFICDSVYAQGNNNILFEENVNQYPSQVTFKTSYGPADIYFENQELTYVLANPEDLDAVHTLKHSAPHQTEGVGVRYHAFRMKFEGSNSPDAIRGTNKVSYYRNYFCGSDQSKWASGVRMYAELNYNNIYDGIDAVFYSRDKQLKYDFVVQSGANASDIKMKYEGLYGLTKSGENIFYHNSAVAFRESEPYAYQIIDGQEVQVPCFFKITGNTVSFDFPDDYDQSYDLVIDPTLIFATLTGSTSDNWGTSATNDVDGNLIACGVAFGTIYPTTLGAFQETFGGADATLGTDISIIKYNETGTDALFSTYLGGSSSEFPHSSIVDGNGEVIVMGTTSSPNFPMLGNSYDDSFGGGNPTDLNNIGYPNGSDIIVAKLSSDGSALNGATFLGGSENDGLNASTNLSFNYSDDARGEVNVDDANNIYISSSTQSLDFPLSAGAFQDSFGGGSQDGVVVKLNNELSNVFWSTYFGGSEDDAVYSSKVDQAGNLYVTGGTNSPDLPSFGTGANAGFQGGPADGFVTHLAGNDGGLIATTFLGTSAFDQSYLLDLDKEGNVYVVGQSLGAYPIEGNVHSDPGTTQFLHKLNSSLTTTLFSTVFGEGDQINISPTAFLVDDCSRIYVSGWGGQTQNSGNGASTGQIGNTNGLFVTPDAIQPTTDGSDFYIILFEPNATAINYASFFGSDDAREHVDGGTSRFDKSGVVYQAVCAGCGGNSFPTTPGVWSEENGSTNCNVGAFKFAFEPDLVTAAFTTMTTECVSAIQFQNLSVGGIDHFWDFGDGETSTEFSPLHEYESIGSFTVTLTVFNPTTCNEEDATLNVLVIGDLPTLGSIEGGGTACADGTISAVVTEETPLDDGQSITFVLSDTPDPEEASVVVNNASGEFSLTSDLESETEYFITAVVQDEDGNLLFNCFEPSNSVTAMWYSPVEIIVDPFCEGETGEFSVTVFVQGGSPPFDGSSYSVTGDGTFDLALGEGATIAFGAFDGGQYSFSAIDDNGCADSFLSDIVACIKNAVELLFFDGRALEVGNELFWATASETNHSHFTVQRLEGSEQWINVGDVAGSGESVFEQHYSFIDKEAVEGESFYRLLSVDFDGNHTRSNVIYISRESSNETPLQIFPVPIRDELHVLFGQQYSSANGVIRNLEGKIMLSEDCSGSSHTFDTSTLPSGLYILQVQYGLQVKHFKILKH